MLGAALGAIVACSGSSVFHCGDDSDCVGPSQDGVCENDVGFCSFPDDSCVGSGRRYGHYAGGGLGGACVPPPDAGGSTGGSAAGSDGGAGPGSGPGGTTGADVTTGGDGATTGGPSGVDWWDCGFAHRRELTITLDDAGIETTESDVPILIVLDETRIDYASAAPDGGDLRFVAADDQTVLSADFEQWDPAGLSFAWVRLPALGTGTTTFYMYWGNPAAGPPESGASTWNDGYAAVWHLGADGLDATVNGNLLSLDQASVVDGQVSDGLQFTAFGSPAIAAASPSLTGAFAGGGTLSAWIRAEGWGGGPGGGAWVVGNASTVYGDGGWLLGVNGDHDAPHFERGFESGHREAYGTDGSLNLERWVHLAVVYDEDSLDNVPVFYVDGQMVSADTVTGAPTGIADPDDARSVAIGGPEQAHGGGSEFTGIIDEVRISSVPRSSTWIHLQYLSATDGLVTYGPPHTAPCTAG